MGRKFYDIHYHLFDLSHPNILAFILREDLIGKDSIKKVLLGFPFLLKIMPLWIASLFPGKAVRKVKEYLHHDAGNIRNLLSVLEGAIEYHFLYIEYFLLRAKRYFGDHPGAKYNKIVVCPLLMDFGYKNLSNEECFYNLPPAKPIVNQVADLINAIRFYYNYDLIMHPGKSGRLKIIPTTVPRDKKLFEIYPFLGINTRNYDLDEMVELFDKYFGGYEKDNDPSIRQKNLYDRLGTVHSDLEDLIFRRKEKNDPDYFRYLFAGIKLYPPLGFDPWPENEPRELEKVRFLYSECIRKNLPVTVHCSDGGYITAPSAMKLTDPSAGWKKVLSQTEFRKLKINFAHLGTQRNGKTDWQNTILELMTPDRNVYTDCACQTPTVKDYERVRNIMNPGSESNILFGSDFVINLIWSKSYNDYLDNFVQSEHLGEKQKELICEINPERFLFG